MWVFMKEGFISIVEDRTSSQFLWCRSRTAGQLEKIFPEHVKQVTRTPNHDYAFRLKLRRAVVVDKMIDAVEGIDYDNFKGAILNPEYHSACSRVWSAFVNACKTGCYATFGGKSRKGKRSASGAEPFDADLLARKNDAYYADLFGEMP